MIRAGHDFWATLSTGEWAVIVQDDAKGFTMPHKAIVIRQRDHGSRDYLGTCIHEATHASRPDMTEAEVQKLEADITEIVWKRGYRLPKPPKKRKAQTS
jgi:hypothetical protein